MHPPEAREDLLAFDEAVDDAVVARANYDALEVAVGGAVDACRRWGVAYAELARRCDQSEKTLRRCHRLWLDLQSDNGGSHV